MRLPVDPHDQAGNELAVAAGYRAEAAAFFQASCTASPADQAALRLTGSDLRALAISIERAARDIPGLEPRGLVGP